MIVRDFNLGQTLECGQCFNFDKLYDNEYIVVAYGRMLHIKQEGDELQFLNASQDEVEKIWIPYFDLDQDYGAIKKAIIDADPNLESVIEQYYGIRILNQEFIETLMSFIISQNKSIPQIKQLVRRISESYGDKLGTCEINGRDYFSFPGVEILNTVSEQDFRDMKTGFRAAYLRNAVDRLVERSIVEDDLRSMDFNDAKRKLTEIKGVGDKVANCVLLFGLGFRNAFPVDVWIKRIMEELYFHKETDRKIIEKFAEEKFGELGGYAQQYLFIYAKNR